MTARPPHQRPIAEGVYVRLLFLRKRLSLVPCPCRPCVCGPCDPVTCRQHCEVHTARHHTCRWAGLPPGGERQRVCTQAASRWPYCCDAFRLRTLMYSSVGPGIHTLPLLPLLSLSWAGANVSTVVIAAVVVAEKFTTKRAPSVGAPVGVSIGMSVGAAVGASVGASVGESVGLLVAAAVCTSVYR